MILLIAPAPLPPVFTGDAEAGPRLEDSLRGAMAATEGYGAWPGGAWQVHLHEEDLPFERATGAPPQRAAAWVGAVLHLRPWTRLQRRDLGAVLRHELVHRRLRLAGLRRWEEEVRCLHAETHTRPPDPWPAPPRPGVQDRLDRALQSGTTLEQAWAYRALRAWLEGRALPPPASPKASEEGLWRKESLGLGETIVVRWAPERLPGGLLVNGQRLSHATGKVYRFEGSVRFGGGSPVRALEGRVRIRWSRKGWDLTWRTSPEGWVAAAIAGELGEEAPLEARRALASVLRLWLKGHPRGHHKDGSLCPLTHCAVIRGSASAASVRDIGASPALALDPSEAFFCASKGGVSLSPRQVWGGGSDQAPPVPRVPGDPWLDWERRLSAEQVRALKRELRPGVRPGQVGLRLGASGPFPVEELRLNAGRAFGWPTWPSNACAVEVLPGGGLLIRGHGWGHNAGLCLAAAVFRAREGWGAGAILEEAFGPGAVK